MKPEELRIGNWVKWHDEKEPNEVPWAHGHWLGVHAKNYSFPEAIPITEEWLEKLGFKEETDDYLISRHNNPCESHTIYNFWDEDRDKRTSVHFIVSTYGGDPYHSIAYYNQDDLIRNIEFVHQLQNLYYAINEKEL